MNIKTYMQSWSSLICVVTWLWDGWRGAWLLTGASSFSKIHPGWLCGLGLGVEQCRPGVNHTHEVPRLRMGGAMLPLFLCALMVWTGTTFLYIQCM